jgi:transposase
MLFYLGIDVSKAKLDCCLIKEDTPDKRKSKVVANSAAGVTDLLHWLDQQGAQPATTHALLEGTGVYHESAATALHDGGVIVSILNPAQVRDFGKGLGQRSKTDRIDSYLLARFGLMLRPASWQPPPAHVRQLRALLARRQALSEDLQRERNRLEKAQATNTPERIMHSLHECITFLERQLAQLQRDIDNHIDQHPDLKQEIVLLQSIPAVGPQVSISLLCVMRSGSFRTTEQLAAYLGVVPIERQSGTSLLGRARLSKAGPARMRALLYLAVVTYTDNGCHVQQRSNSSWPCLR